MNSTPLLTESELKNLEAEMHQVLDARGLLCPEPVMMLHNLMKKLEGGNLIKVLATDPSTQRDIPSFCQHLQHQLLYRSDSDSADEEIVFWLRKRQR